MPIIEKISGVTSEEQSNLLLAAGLDPATADMSIIENPRGGVILVNTPPMVSKDLPCWSMSALWKICRQRGILLEFLTDETEESVVANMVKVIIEDIEEIDKQSLDFIKRSISK